MTCLLFPSVIRLQAYLYVNIPFVIISKFAEKLMENETAVMEKVSPKYRRGHQPHQIQTNRHTKLIRGAGGMQASFGFNPHG